MSKVTGVATVKINSKLTRSKEGAKLNFGGKERTTVVADGRVVGYSEKVVPATVECTIAHTADTDVAELNDMVDGTVLFECDTGVTYQVDGAHTTKPCELTGGEGDLSFACAGEPATKV